MSASRSNTFDRAVGTAVSDADRHVGMNGVHGGAGRQTDRCADRRQCSLSDRSTSSLVGPGDQHRELVAAETGNGIARTHQARQALADDLQHDVAAGMAEAVVDEFEVVEIEDTTPRPARC